MVTPAPDFTAYSLGEREASVCSSLPRDEIEERMNIVNPTGPLGKWKVSGPEPKKGGPPNPHNCLTNPDTHKHYHLYY